MLSRRNDLPLSLPKIQLMILTTRAIQFGVDRIGEISRRGKTKGSTVRRTPIRCVLLDNLPANLTLLRDRRPILSEGT